MMNRFSQFCALGATLMALSSCSTVNDLVTSHLPESHSGRPSIAVSLREQEAYLYRGGYRTASSRISSGREGYRTPIGRFQVIVRTKIIAPVSMVTTLMTRAGSWRPTSIAGVTADRRIRTLWAPRCPTFWNSRRATDCTRATCQGWPHHTDALGCPIGKRASFITRLTSGHQWS